MLKIHGLKDLMTGLVHTCPSSKVRVNFNVCLIVRPIPAACDLAWVKCHRRFAKPCLERYSCCQKGSRSALFLSAFRRSNVAEEKCMNPKLLKYLFSWVTHLCLHNIAVSISHLVYISVSLRGALGLELVSALMLEEISHDYERHSNVAVFLLLTETIESEDRVPNVYT